MYISNGAVISTRLQALQESSREIARLGNLKVTISNFHDCDDKGTITNFMTCGFTE